MSEVMRVRTVWSGSLAANGLSTMYFRAPMDATTAQAAVDKVRDFWTALNAHIMLGVRWTVLGTVDELDNTGLLVASQGATSRTGTGTLVSDALPLQTQGEVAWLTGSFVGGRRQIGRTFIGWPGEVDSTDGIPVAGYVTALQTAASALVTAAPNELAVWSRAHQLHASVTSAVARGEWRVLRSRRH